MCLCDAFDGSFAIFRDYCGIILKKGFLKSIFIFTCLILDIDGKVTSREHFSKRLRTISCFYFLLRCYTLCLCFADALDGPSALLVIRSFVIGALFIIACLDEDPY